MWKRTHVIQALVEETHCFEKTKHKLTGNHKAGPQLPTKEPYLIQTKWLSQLQEK